MNHFVSMIVLILLGAAIAFTFLIGPDALWNMGKEQNQQTIFETTERRIP